MVKITWKKYQIITVAFTAFFILASGGLAFWIYQSYTKALEDEASYQTQISTARVKRDKVPGLEKEVVILRESVKEFVKILPDTKEVNGFVKKLSDFDDQSGVELYVLKDDTRASRRKKLEVFDRETFRVELRGNIFQFLKFISLVENYERFIKISEIQIKAGNFDEEILKSDVVHQVSLLVETFVYHGNEGIAGATKIQNYEKKRELLKDEIDSKRHQIKIERYEYAYDPTIRDPFIDPRTWASGQEVTEGLAVQDQEKFISDVMEKIYEIKELLDVAKRTVDIPLIRRLEIQKEVGARIIDLNDQIKQSMEERWITDPACRRKFENEIMPEVSSINTEIDPSNIGPVAISLKELEDLRDQLVGLFDNEDFEGCVSRFKILKGQLGTRISEVTDDDEKHQIYNEIKDISMRAGIAQEFMTKELKISGIICQPNRSVVIVNGRVLKEGHLLEEELSIERIEEKEVYFNYKGQIFRVRP